VLRVTVTEAAIQAGRFRSRSWLVIKAVDGIECGDGVYFFARQGHAWQTVLCVSAEDVMWVEEV
jgi:hypothetical protein